MSEVNQQTPQEQFLSILLLAAEKSMLRKAVFSKPLDKSVLRMVLTKKKIGERVVLQAEYFHSDNKATHVNIPMKDAKNELTNVLDAFMQANLLIGEVSCEYRRSKSGNETVIGGKKALSILWSGDAPKVAEQGNNREKLRVLSGSESFLHALGIADANGRVYDKKQLKFRQINRFVEMIRDVEQYLPKGKITICDLCCGKSYLSFAVYHYFANVLGYEVQMIGVDLKPDVIAYCSDVAKKLSFNGLSFQCGNVKDFQMSDKPDLVVSLHACDIATDYVLERAVAWGARVILSTPCCHHELNHTIHCEPLRFVEEHSMLRQKLCDAVTDSLRLKWLEAHGYRTAALELVEDAPKNILLRAIRQDHFDMNSQSAKRLMAQYAEARRFLGVAERCGLLDAPETLFPAE